MWAGTHAGWKEAIIYKQTFTKSGKHDVLTDDEKPLEEGDTPECHCYTHARSLCVAEDKKFKLRWHCKKHGAEES
jgi:hypothetical protein